MPVQIFGSGSITGISAYLASNGTNSSPALAFTGSTSTGIYSPTVNSIGIVTNATEQLRIDSSGNVGINVTSPTQKLHVSGNAYITGGYYDSNNSVGTSGRLLSSTGSGTSWVSSISVTSISDAIGNVRSIPINNQTASYILAATDAGKCVSITTGGVTIPSGVFNPGDAIMIFNNSGSSQTITQGASATVYNSADGTTGNRTLALRGMASILCVASNVFSISGGGLT